MQKLRYSKYFKIIMVMLDLLLIAGLFGFFYLQNQLKQPVFDFYKNTFFIILILFSFWMLLSGKTKIYDVPRYLTYTLYMERFFYHMIFFVFGVFVYSQVIDLEYIRNHALVVSFVVLIVFWFLKTLVFLCLKYIRTLGKNHRNIMFLGDIASVSFLKESLRERKDYGYKIINYPNKNIDLENLVEFWKDKGIFSLYIPAEGFVDFDTEQKLFALADEHKVKIFLVPDFIGNHLFTYQVSYFNSQPVLSPMKFPLEYESIFFIKRLFDVVFSSLFLIFIGVWLFPIIAILVKQNSSGDVFFLQKRYGFQDEIFNCIKFRTMYVNGTSSEKTTTKGDVRITSIGKFLRKYSLDETPQFINVLLGQMSLVGPRPHMLAVDDQYRPKILKYKLRNRVKPGLTGLAQVNGLRGDKDNMDLEIKKRIVADAFYVRNWSFSLDILIILKTVILLIKGDKNAI